MAPSVHRCAALVADGSIGFSYLICSKPASAPSTWYAPCSPGYNVYWRTLQEDARSVTFGYIWELTMCRTVSMRAQSWQHKLPSAKNTLGSQMFLMNTLFYRTKQRNLNPLCQKHSFGAFECCLCSLWLLTCCYQYFWEAVPPSN